MRGFSMLELLVAMLVVGVGVLGVAGLGALSLQHGRSATAHADAVLLAHDLMERIRANPAGLAEGGYARGSDAPASADCTAGPCAPQETAAFDLSAWRCALGLGEANAGCDALMNGQGAVAVNGDAVEIAVRWRVRGEDQAVAFTSRG